MLTNCDTIFYLNLLALVSQLYFDLFTFQTPPIHMHACAHTHAHTHTSYILFLYIHAAMCTHDSYCLLSLLSWSLLVLVLALLTK